jgi:hypothetical protein
MTYFIDGGSETTHIKEKIMQRIAENPLFNMLKAQDMSMDEMRKRYIKMMPAFVALMREFNPHYRLVYQVSNEADGRL